MHFPTTHLILISILFGICSLSNGLDCYAQSDFTKFWVSFSDKNNTPYSIDEPQDFLTEKAIERRAKQNIEIIENDLPVDPAYVESLSSLGAEVLYTSKWFNGCAIKVENQQILDEINALPFVLSDEPLSLGRKVRPARHKSKWSMVDELEVFGFDESFVQEEGFYGPSGHQMRMLNGDYVHAKGYMGSGMMIAIMDVGYINLNELEVFDEHFNNNKIIATKDFVEGDTDVFGHGTHGTHVASILGGNSPGFYVGAAPQASLLLLRTEDGASETRMEEYNWLAAAEFADSLGVDVINTSLGYSDFDYEEMDYEYADLDGNTTIITRAADIAAAKGILVVASAGNQGNTPWKKITAPADGDSVLAVGAVDSLGFYSSFSSLGPAADGDVKPNVTAQGFLTSYVNKNGDLKIGNGTSYSGPIVAGLATCLWQAYPDLTNMEIMDLIERSATQFSQPDAQKGYGLPDFYAAYLSASGSSIYEFEQRENTTFLYPNPFSDELNLYYFSHENEDIELIIRDVSGRLISYQKLSVRDNTSYKFNLSRLNVYDKGVYFIQLNNSAEQIVLKAIKVKS